MAAGDHFSVGGQECVAVPSARTKSLPVGVITGRPAGSQGKHRSERTRPTVAVVDSRSLTREGLVRLLEAADRFSVIAVPNHYELLLDGADLRLDGGTILMNLGANSVTEDSFREAIAQLAVAFPSAPVIVVSDHEDSLQIDEALHQGVRGYIPTTLTSGILVEAVRLILAGGTFIPAHVFAQTLADRQKIADLDSEVTVQQPDLNRLTPRQREVLELLRQGKPNKIIAYELSMQESTVKVHVRQIMRKLRASNRTQAAFFASRCLE